MTDSVRTGSRGDRAAVVLISSTRAAAGVYADKTGPLLVEWLRGKGFRVGEPVVRADGEDFAAALRAALGAGAGQVPGSAAGAADGAALGSVAGPAAGRAPGSALGEAGRGIVGAGRPDLVITSGGTGISPTDVTPQVTASLLDYEVPGLAEALRRRGADAGVPTAVLSRGLVGVAGRTLVVNLPGSSGGVKDGMAVLDGVLDHALDQLAGGDHVRADVSAGASHPPDGDVGGGPGAQQPEGGRR